MEQTQLLDWNDESLMCETLEDKDGNQDPVGRLRVLSSSYGPEKDFWIHCGENIIGRQTTCHIPIPAPSISKRHAVIEAEVEGSHFIYDCGSLNRTRRQKNTLKPHARYALVDGDLLLFADVACQYFILPQPSENGTCQADASGQGLIGSPHARDTDSDDSVLVPGTQGCPARPLVIEKTPAVGAVRKMGYGGVLAKDSDDDSEESDRSRSLPRQGERASQESTMSAEGRHVPNSSAVFTPATSNVVPESDTEEEQQESTTRKDLELQPEQQRGAAGSEQGPQDLFHLDSDTDVEDEDFSSNHNQRKGSSDRKTQSAERKGGPSTSYDSNKDPEKRGPEQPAVGIKKSRMFIPALDSDIDTEGGRTERSSVGLGDSSNASTDQDSDTDVERERERRPGVGEGDSRQANADQDSDTDMEIEGMERPGAGEGDSVQVSADQDSDTDEGIERPGTGGMGIRQATAYQDSNTDVGGEGIERLHTREGGIRQAPAYQDSDTDVEGEGMEKGSIRQAIADLDSDTDVEREGIEKPSIRQATSDLDNDIDVEEEETERLSTGGGHIRQATADFDSDTDVEEEGAERLGTVGKGPRKSCAQQNSETDVEGAGLKSLSVGEEGIGQPCVHHVTDTDMEQGSSIEAADHSTPVEQRSSQRRPGPCDASEDEEENDTDDGPSFAMLDTQCYLNPSSKIWEEEREASIEMEEEATQIFTSGAPTSELFKKPFVLRPSERLRPPSEKTEGWADDQLVEAETQRFCDSCDLGAISSKGGAENIEVEPTQAFLQQEESEEVSQEETQPIALYLSLRAAVEPQKHYHSTDTMTVLQRQAVSENQANNNTAESRPPPPPLEKGEKSRISTQPNILQLSISDEQTQAYTVEIANENVMAESLHQEGEILKECREMESAFSGETRTYAVSLAEEEQVTGTLKVCREEAEPQEQETLENFTEVNQVSKDSALTTLSQSVAATKDVIQPLTSLTISNHPCTDPERERGEEKASPEEARTCKNTGQDSGNDATQGEVPLPPLVKGSDRTGEEEVKKEGRKKSRKEKKYLKEEEKPTKSISDVLEAGESSAVQQSEEWRSLIPGPAEEDKGRTSQEKKACKKGSLRCRYQRKQSKEQEEPPPVPGDHGNSVVQAADSRSGDKQETPVPAQVLEPKSRSTRSIRRKPEVREEKETEQEHWPSPAPSRASKRIKKTVSESTTNEAPDELEAPSLTRTRSRRGFRGTEEASKGVTAHLKCNRKSVKAEKGEVKEEDSEPQNLECVREKSTLGTGETKEQTPLKRHQVGADVMDLPHEEVEEKGLRTGATTAFEEKLPAAEDHTAAKSQETAGGRGIRKKRPAGPAQEDEVKSTQIDANTEPKRRRTQAAAMVASDDATNSQRSQSREAAAVPSLEEREVGLERARRGSVSSKASQESLDFTQATPSRSSRRSRLTVPMSEDDIPSKRERRSSSHGSSEKQDQDPSSSSQESLVAGQRLQKQSSTASSEDKAEDAAVVAPQEANTPRRTCRTHSISSSPGVNRDMAVPKVMFTGVIDEDGEQVVHKLGGEMAESVYECTHLITDRVRRTVKFLCALARGIPIVTLDWLKKCGRSGCFLCPSGFLVKDVEQERNFSFSLSGSLQKARRGQLFEGYEIHVTPSVKPEPEYMKDIIQCSGATFLPTMPRTYREKRVVISCPEDLPKCKPAFNAALPVANTEFMLTGILQQVIDLQAYVLEAEAQESTGKRTSKRGALNNDTASTRKRQR